MAQITITIYGESNNQALSRTQVIGRKMTDAWMRKHYGKDWKSEYNAMWYVKKSHSWVIDSKSRFEDHFYELSGFLNLPYGKVIIYVK